jgi:hypothetical protein
MLHCHYLSKKNQGLCYHTTLWFNNLSFRFRKFLVNYFQVIDDEHTVKNIDNRGRKIVFVFQLPFIDCILSKIVGFRQLWTVF